MTAATSKRPAFRDKSKTWLTAAALATLSACGPAVTPESPPNRASTSTYQLPPMKTFSGSGSMASTRSNTQIAQDFLDLAFRMESGRVLDRMTRFEGPIRVKVNGGLSNGDKHDLERLVARIRAEAGIDISITTNGDAQIYVQGVPHVDLQRAVPSAACFVVPRVSNWTEFLRNRHSATVDWATLERRESATIFVPSDAAPQEIRDCLHEEMAQALGPLNDLYRLPDSVFNDDNIQAVLTGFDMLVLRAYYAPELANGMSRTTVQSRLPALLARLNPSGEQGTSEGSSYSPRAYTNAIERALSQGSSNAVRRLAAQEALSIAHSQQLGAARVGYAYFALGRLELANDPSAALAAFRAADAAFRRTYETRLHTAHVAVQLSAFSLSSGDGPGTLALVDEAIPLAMTHQNAALLATLLMFKAEALDLMGQAGAAATARLDSLAWARYGFGSDRNVRERASEIAALNPAARG